MTWDKVTFTDVDRFRESSTYMHEFMRSVDIPIEIHEKLCHAFYSVWDTLCVERPDLMFPKEDARGEIVSMWPLDIRGIGAMEIGEIGYADQEAVMSECLIDETCRIYEEWYPESIKVKCVGLHMYSVEFSSISARRNRLRECKKSEGSVVS